MSVETERLPSLAPPDEDGIAHVTNLLTYAKYCGSNRQCGCNTHYELALGQSHCRCGQPFCLTCLDMARVHFDSGIAP